MLGLRIDTAINLTDRLDIQVEQFAGAELVEYIGGIGQSLVRSANQTNRSSGGWGEVFVYLMPKLHIHSGYGIDSPLNQVGDTFLLTENQTWLTNVIWSWMRNV